MHNFHFNTFGILIEVMRYSPESLHNEFGEDFELMDSVRETHHTPFGIDQKFIYCYCRKY